MVSCKYKDTRNNWIEFIFVSKCRYNVFRKQSTIDVCTTAFKEFEKLGFGFGNIGYGGNHVHLSVNVPKRYSVQSAQAMMKSRSAQRIFDKIPGFRKRYPRGSFWSGYEHHKSIGIDREIAENYIKNQQSHHSVQVINDLQMRLTNFK